MSEFRMPFPRASTALSRFTVLDLTRVRSGPTCVRQLADWGANVIKIDALTGDSGGELPGGPRQGSDFQHLHRNWRAMSLNLKDPKGLRCSCVWLQKPTSWSRISARASNRGSASITRACAG